MSIFGVFHKYSRGNFRLSRRNNFVAAFLFMLAGFAAVSLLLNALAAGVPVPSVDIYSTNASYSNDEPGSWHINKSARWIDDGIARITYTIDSIERYNPDHLDVVLVLDTRILYGGRISQTQPALTDYITNTLSDQNNTMGLVAYAISYEIKTSLTNDADTLSGLLDTFTFDTTNWNSYYRGLLGATQLLEDCEYEEQDGRQLLILFLTDSALNKDYDLEKAQYQILKTRYPNVVINTIQYKISDTDRIISQLADMSDHQYSAVSSELSNTLTEATTLPYLYDTFMIEDSINLSNWSMLGDTATSSIGSVQIDSASQKLIWDMSGLLRSGQGADLTVDIEVNDDTRIHLSDDLILPVSFEEAITTKLEDESSSYTVNSNLTPILKSSYEVSYSQNLPSGCTPVGDLPATTSQIPLKAVEVSDNRLTCNGYIFKGWKVDSAKATPLNDDYFRMPEENVVIKAVWGKPSISKSMEGQVTLGPKAIFDTGETVNVKMKKLSGQSSATITTSNTSITDIVRSDTLPSSINTSNSNNKISAANSEVPIYAWYSGGIIYYYTETDNIYLNEDIGSMFHYLTKITNVNFASGWNASEVKNMTNLFRCASSLTDISGLSGWDTSSTTDMTQAFSQATSLTSVSALSGWNTSNVTSFGALFIGARNLTDISGLSGWDTSSVINMRDLFSNDSNLSDISALSNWNTSNVEDMSNLLYQASSVTDISALSNWNTSKNTTLLQTFAYTGITNIDALQNWNTSKVTSMRATFAYADKLVDIDGAENWNTSEVTDMYGLFLDATSLENIDGAINWNVSKVTDMTGVFYDAKALTNIDGAINWRPSSATTMSMMFYHAESLADIDGAINWTTSNVTSMRGMFYYAKSLADIDGASNWNTAQVTDMSNMFSYATSLADISGASGWNTAAVTTFASTFSSTAITNINDLSGWVTTNATTIAGMFSRAENLADITGASGWNISKVTSLASTFQDTAITNIDALSNWNTGNVTNMNSLFSGASSLLNVDGASRWSTTKVTTMRYLLSSAQSLTSISGLSSWNTANVTNMSSMFSNVYNVTNLDALSNWNTGNVTNMSSMFLAMKGLTNVDGVSNWNTAKVTNMGWLFESTEELIDIEGLRRWNTGNVTNMYRMFIGAEKITNLDALANWNVTKVTTMESMFQGAYALTDISGLSNWTTTSLTTIGWMFSGDYRIASLAPLENWDATNITDMYDAFYGISSSVARPSWYSE